MKSQKSGWNPDPDPDPSQKTTEYFSNDSPHDFDDSYDSFYDLTFILHMSL